MPKPDHNANAVDMQTVVDGDKVAADKLGGDNLNGKGFGGEDIKIGDVEMPNFDAAVRLEDADNLINMWQRERCSSLRS